MEDRSREAEKRAGAEAREHVAELADRGVGEHPFEVVLHGANQRRDQGRRRSHDRHQRQGAGAGDEQRCRAGDEVDARRHHRGGVDQGAGRRGAFHGVGQPDVQRELGALATGGEQEQQADRGADRTADVARGIGEPGRSENARQGGAVSERRVVEVERAVGHPEQERGHREAEVADAVDQKGLLGGLGRLGPGEPKADQQVAAGAHRLPEDVHEQEVARRHEHRHREHEHRHQGEESRIAGVAVHVADRIDGDEQADEGDDHQQGRGQWIQSQRHRDREGCGGARGIRPRCLGVGHAGPFPERGHHLDRPDGMLVPRFSDAHFAGHAHKQRDRHGRRAGDPGHGRKVGPRAEDSAERDGEDRSHQRQERHENQERRWGEVWHGYAGRAGTRYGAELWGRTV